MTISKITGECPECEENVAVDYSEAEIYLQKGRLMITFECPECGALVDEEMEKDY